MARCGLAVRVAGLLITLLFVREALAIDVSVENNTDVLLDWFLSPGSASNAYFHGASSAVGTYTNTSRLWGLSPGIVLSSGNVLDYGDGPNTSGSHSTDFGRGGDPDLAELTGYPSYDAASFGFDFTATSNRISFDFVYGTDEYPEWVGTQYNDAFGAWLTDRSGMKTQLSFDHEGHPITVNAAWMSATSRTELDGTTGLLCTQANVVKGQPYNIEFAIGDSSDHVWDSTVYLSNFRGAHAAKSADVYGLFLGVRQDDLRGDKQAQQLYDKISQNLVGFKEGVVLTANMANDGLTLAQVQQAIDDLKAKMVPGDKFIFYSASHGGSYSSDTETTLSPGDEYVSIGEDLNDDILTSYLSGMDGIEKWVWIDACHSGGFWGNNNPLDEGDLEKLANISMFAASAEDKFGYYGADSGLTCFGSALVKAFSLDLVDRHLFADLDGSSVVTFGELVEWVQASGTSYVNQTVYEMDFGDPVLFTSDMWSPTGMASLDLGGGFLGGDLPPLDPVTDLVPVPGAVFLGVIGLSYAGWHLRRRTT